MEDLHSQATLQDIVWIRRTKGEKIDPPFLQVSYPSCKRQSLRNPHKPPESSRFVTNEKRGHSLEAIIRIDPAKEGKPNKRPHDRHPTQRKAEDDRGAHHHNPIRRCRKGRQHITIRQRHGLDRGGSSAMLKHVCALGNDGAPGPLKHVWVMGAAKGQSDSR